MAALCAGLTERTGRPRADARPDLQARRHARGIGRPGRLGARAQVMVPADHVTDSQRPSAAPVQIARRTTARTSAAPTEWESRTRRRSRTRWFATARPVPTP